MVLIGVSWFLFWLLVKVFAVELLNAAIGTAVVFILLGILTGERPLIK